MEFGDFGKGGGDGAFGEFRGCRGFWGLVAGSEGFCFGGFEGAEFSTRFGVSWGVRTGVGLAMKLKFKKGIYHILTNFAFEVFLEFFPVKGA